MLNYKCPKCNSVMICCATTSIPPILTYQCISCGYISKPFSVGYNCKILPTELQVKEVKENDCGYSVTKYVL